MSSKPCRQCGTVPKKWLSIHEGAKYLRVDETLFREMVELGEITSYMTVSERMGGYHTVGGGRRLVNADELDEYIRSRPVKPRRDYSPEERLMFLAEMRNQRRERIAANNEKRKAAV